MCCQIPTERKKQQATGFVDGWTFTFEPADDSSSSTSSDSVLILLSATGRRFQTIEHALSVFPEGYDKMSNYASFLKLIGEAG